MVRLLAPLVLIALLIGLVLAGDRPLPRADLVYVNHADVTTLRDMIMRRQVEPERWERRFSDADVDEDLDEGEIKRAAPGLQLVLQENGR